MAWKQDDTELLVASKAGVHSLNLLGDSVAIFCCPAQQEAISCIRWNENANLIMSAGDGMIQV